jgi:hypothetical protein
LRNSWENWDWRKFYFLERLCRLPGILFPRETEKWCLRVLVLPYPHQHLLLFLPLKMAILTGVRWNLSIVLVCISSLPLRIPCLIRMPISSLGCWVFGGWVFKIPCRFWILVPYWMNSWQRFSSILWTVS